MSDVVAIIPARYGSTRFPGKALVNLAGCPMVVRVARQALASKAVHKVIVATDDPRIEDVVKSYGLTAVMTSSACRSGSDRVAEVVRTMEKAPAYVVNLQGDEPLLDPRDIDALVDQRQTQGITTLACPFPEEWEPTDPNRVKVVADQAGLALYFSRAAIPGRLHLGIYGYPPAVLERFTTAPAGKLETIERLEQLRALEMGIPIKVVEAVSGRPPIGVDTPEDAAHVEQMLQARDGS